MAVTTDTLRRAAELRNTVGAEADATVRSVTKAWLNEWASLAPRWRTAVADVLALRADLNRWPSPWELARAERVQRALRATELSLTVLAAGATAAATAAALNASDATVEQEPAIIASQLPPAAIAASTIVIAGLVAESAIETGRTGIRRRIVRQLSGLAAAGADTVRRMLLQPGPAGGTAAGLLAAVSGGFDTALGGAITATRTETVDAYRATARTVHLASSNILSGWSWHCRCDLQSCPACWAMDGTEYAADEPGPFGHVGCRCVRLPLVRVWRALGYSQHEPPSVIQPARDRFDALPIADQIKILGPGRHELLTSGRIDWADLATRRENPSWRPSYVPTTVRDLQRLTDRRQPA